MPPRLSARSLRAAAQQLAVRDPRLGASVARHGPPPLWAREPGFATLVHLILEQQVSLASAQAAFDRLASALGGTPTPTGLLRLSDGELRAIGFSRQKAGYARGLSTAVLDGFDLGSLDVLGDDEVRATLTSLKGVGRWTADVYLTMCLLRPDAWPHGDLALATSAQAVLGLDERPSYDDLEAHAAAWRPHRAVAARILWQDYLRSPRASGVTRYERSGTPHGPAALRLRYARIFARLPHRSIVHQVRERFREWS